MKLPLNKREWISMDIIICFLLMLMMCGCKGRTPHQEIKHTVKFGPVDKSKHLKSDTVSINECPDEVQIAIELFDAKDVKKVKVTNHQTRYIINHHMEIANEIHILLKLRNIFLSKGWTEGLKQMHVQRYENDVYILYIICDKRGGMPGSAVSLHYMKKEK